MILQRYRNVSTFSISSLFGWLIPKHIQLPHRKTKQKTLSAERCVKTTCIFRIVTLWISLMNYFITSNTKVKSCLFWHRTCTIFNGWSGGFWFVSSYIQTISGKINGSSVLLISVTWNYYAGIRFWNLVKSLTVLSTSRIYSKTTFLNFQIFDTFVIFTITPKILTNTCRFILSFSIVGSLRVWQWTINVREKKISLFSLGLFLWETPFLLNNQWFSVLFLINF